MTLPGNARVSSRQACGNIKNFFSAPGRWTSSSGAGPQGSTTMTRYIVFWQKNVSNGATAWGNISAFPNLGGWLIVPGPQLFGFQVVTGAGTFEAFIVPAMNDMVAVWVFHMTFDGTTFSAYSNGRLAASVAVVNPGYTPPNAGTGIHGVIAGGSNDHVQNYVAFGGSDSVAADAGTILTHANEMIDALEQGRHPLPTFTGQQFAWDASDITAVSATWSDELSGAGPLTRIGNVEIMGRDMRFVEMF